MEPIGLESCNISLTDLADRLNHLCLEVIKFNKVISGISLTNAIDNTHTTAYTVGGVCELFCDFNRDRNIMNLWFDYGWMPDEDDRNDFQKILTAIKQLGCFILVDHLLGCIVEIDDDRQLDYLIEFMVGDGD